jgi:hypothetical protein
MLGLARRLLSKPSFRRYCIFFADPVAVEDDYHRFRRRNA